MKRSSSGKRRNARGAADRGAGDPDEVCAERAPGVCPRRARALDVSLPRAAPRLVGVPRPAPRARRRATPVRISSPPRPAAARRLSREPQTHLSALHAGGSHRPTTPAATARTPSSVVRDTASGEVRVYAGSAVNCGAAGARSFSTRPAAPSATKRWRQHRTTIEASAARVR